jgi:hypothetical protein
MTEPTGVVSSTTFQDFWIANRELVVADVLRVTYWGHQGNERMLNIGNARIVEESMERNSGVGAGTGSIALIEYTYPDGRKGYCILDGQHRMKALELAIADPTIFTITSATTVSCTGV